jgi:hypothetical protein
MDHAWCIKTSAWSSKAAQGVNTTGTPWPWPSLRLLLPAVLLLLL